ncbi:serine/threonine-protein kinase [Micromonospora endolithica]|uniref:non-specific serine/threonine protein kinase n=1 Tax=Micromonospora endolithica TaxID=230091 RepID=A0A3A9Z7J8_9ACTN|nr:serine/threonine-protein kinase [Micromonospora endolithica]RKN44248.1 serine/threonine protein kinase [Micromonospora endolithica]TWJ25715.1 serine/threonine-protein kinase [Micromonospora endolithica]
MGGGVSDGAQRLGERYRLIEQLGAGGMSVVWRGYDEVLGRQVAVKVLASRLAADRAFRHRIRIEAQSAARLCHPNITNVYDYGESEQVGLTVPYVVMELIDGESLTGRLRRGKLPWREAVTVGAEVASALATAHARGVVHRDVTPGNVMITANGVKVVDFGISALVGEKEKGPDGTLLGTPAYLAPERLDNGEVSPATDVYAMGLLLYRMLTGRLPWQADTTTQMLRAHMYTDPEPMPPVPGLPDAVRDLTRRCLAKRPTDRPTTVEVARTLAEAAGMLPAVPVSPAPTGDDAAELANAGTTILPWSAATDALPFSRTRNRRSISRRRRIEAAVAAMGLVAVTGALWGVTSRSPASGGVDQPTEARMGAEKTVSCGVAYALRTDSGRDFSAELALTNTGTTELRDWRLSFTLPGQQAVTGGKPAGVRQEGRTVRVEPAPQRTVLAAGSTEKVTLSGRYTGANPLPVEFRVHDEVCAVQVSGVAGSPPSTAPKAPAVKETPPVKKAPAAAKAPPKKSTAGSGGSKAKPTKAGKGGGGGGKKPWRPRTGTTMTTTMTRTTTTEVSRGWRSVAPGRCRPPR